MAEPSYAYMLRCSDGTLYTGWSSDPQRRVRTHNRGRGAAYTRSRRPVRLVYVEECPSRAAAMRREQAIKRLSRNEKLSLIRGGLRSDPLRHRGEHHEGG